MASNEKVEILPVALKQGLPAAKHNGLFGLEKTMIDAPGSQVTAIVTFALKDIVHQEIAGTRRPVIEFQHIEPITDAGSVVEVLALRDEAYTARTGADQLDFDDIEKSGSDE
jgi:hypothetical protein